MKMQERQFRIGPMAEHVGVERFVIRFWEKEFGIQSHRSPGGQRFYTQKDLKTFKQIKKLLYKDGFTITGAKQQLGQESPLVIGSQKTVFEPSEGVPHDVVSKLHSIKKQLVELKNLLS